MCAWWGTALLSASNVTCLLDTQMLCESDYRCPNQDSVMTEVIFSHLFRKILCPPEEQLYVHTLCFIFIDIYAYPRAISFKEFSFPSNENKTCFSALPLLPKFILFLFFFFTRGGAGRQPVACWLAAMQLGNPFRHFLPKLLRLLKTNV